MRRGFVPAQTLIKANDQPRACRRRLPRNPLPLSPATVRLLVVRPVKLRLCPFLLLAFLLEDGDVDATAFAIDVAAARRRWYASAFPHDFSIGGGRDGMGYVFLSCGQVHNAKTEGRVVWCVCFVASAKRVQRVFCIFCV